MAELSFPDVTGRDIENCCFSSWYAKYHRLSPRARIIKPVPEEFLNFLKSDGIVIPGTYSTSHYILLTYSNTTSLISEIEEIDEDTETNVKHENEDDHKEDPLADFTALLTREIALLNGSVVPKLNWSTPKVLLPPNKSTDFRTLCG